MRTIKSFLSGIGLEQYYKQFLQAGATDQDLPQLVQFNDQELTEFLSALDMLPFHCIKIKKSLRELKGISELIDSRPMVTTETTNSSATMLLDDTNSNYLIETASTREFIISHATIYGKKKNRRLTSYEEAINNAALQLALDNPLLISKKGSLFDLAKKKLLEDGYCYKRGSSRSKLKDESHTNNNNITKRSTSTITSTNITLEQRQDILQKRQENAKKQSDKRLEKIQHLQYQVDQALKNRQATENKLAGGNYHHDALTRLAMEADLIRYEETKIKLTKEISKLKAQERKHQWYKRRKNEERGTFSSSSSSGGCLIDEGFSSQESNSSSLYQQEQQQQQQQQHHHHSAFSVCAPTSHYSSTTTFTQQQQQQQTTHTTCSSLTPPSPPLRHYPYNTSPSPSPSSSSSSVSSSHTTSTLLTCSRESDVRASSISNYDR